MRHLLVGRAIAIARSRLPAMIFERQEHQF
jgi:hypothetical protein